jgi:hypothetical protein
MKMFRLALAGVLPAFVLLVCIQLNARVTCTPPHDMQSWFTGGDTVNDHIWQPVGTLYNRATYATARVRAPSQSRNSSFRIVLFTSAQLKKCTGAIASGRNSVLIPSHRCPTP